MIYNRHMSFATEEIAEVQNIVELALKEHSQKFFPVFQRDDRELLDRMVRVEEELKHLREDSNKQFAQVEKRFGQVDKHFERARKA